jgi:hypothetical protein
MLSFAFLCNLLFGAMTLAEPAGSGSTVTAFEIVETRQVRLKPQTGRQMRRFGAEQPGMKLVVDVQGADVARASHFGMLEVEAASDDKGGQLKLDEEAIGFHDYHKEFVPIDRERMFFGEEKPPKDLIRVEIPLTPPARSAATVSVRGKLQLKRVETTDLLVAATPGDVKDEQLAKLGLKLKIVKSEEGNGFAYEVSGKLDALNDAKLVDAQGKPLETQGSSSFGDDESQHHEIGLEKPLPAGAKLKLALVVKATNVPVAFDLKDLKLP